MEEEYIKLFLIWNLAFTFIANSPFILAIAIVLNIDDGSCDKPIRQWLIVWEAVNCFLIVIFSILIIEKINKKIQKFLLIFIFIPGRLFSVAWVIVGSLWEFKSDDCYDDFYNGWALNLATLIVDYISIGAFFCLLCYIGMCSCLTHMFRGWKITF
ncbi:unnamed protein product [Blepharisma stoltei]|uniref:Uncharacterized protein n=1 Tax=Blepharisma stoltei TaxID=1481888 RepID=A0AAU9KCE8_9CILI|nr:unnamed protein product [Blepharisma stoltei]